MDDQASLAGRFEEHRPRLRAVAYRMLGSLAAADDALQDAWERVQRAGADQVENLGGWLTTIVARVCLNMLRTRTVRREDLSGVRVPDPVVTRVHDALPEDQVLMADAVGLALQIVLDTLSPAERLAFVLHDMFDLPFEEIGRLLGRTTQATRQLASRARRRVHTADIDGLEADPVRQRAVVDAFFAASRAGDLDTLICLLHPDVVLRADFGPGLPRSSRIIRGADGVARQAQLGARQTAEVIPAVLGGGAGAIITRQGQPFALFAFTIRQGQIVEIDSIADPHRAQTLAATALG